jgi:dihydrofolate reductase
MTKIIVTAFVSADGVMEGPGGEPGYRNNGWTFKNVPFDAAAYEIKGREQEEAGGLLLGRRSYEAFAPVWPSMDDFARYNELPRYVVSRTLSTDDDRWPATILSSLDEVAALKEQDGAPLLVHGSAELGASLADAGLVDRYHLLVFPLLLGAGKRLFSATDKDAEQLALVEQETYGNGVTKQVWDVVRG